jgi:DnaJ-domain-containing protein 1
MEITLQIPEKLGILLPKRDVMSRELLEAYAADAYRNEKLTRYEVGQLLGLDRWQAEEFLVRHQAQRPFGFDDMVLERSSHRPG